MIFPQSFHFPKDKPHRWKILKMRRTFSIKCDVINQLRHSENSLAASRWDSVERWMHAFACDCMSVCGVNMCVCERGRERLSKLARDVGHLNLPLHGMCLCFHMIMQGIRTNEKEPTFHLIWFCANEAHYIP